ncbi:MAG TPA: hypothetical protein VMB26_05530 [Candidatus Binataceae bacterium]|nr:hypothetical protein [Candidatus Binataceae bacterium]
MIDPIEVIGRARRRIAEVAALRVAVYLVPPLVILLALGAGFQQVAAATWERWGYVLAPALGRMMHLGLLLAAAIGLAIAALSAWLAYRRASSFVEAAERIDLRVQGKQEIVTLATLSGPNPLPETQRSSLFPILLRRSMEYLSDFDPAREFRLELGAPLAKSSALTLALVVVLGLSMLALVRPPGPLEAQARKLEYIAKEISANDSSPGSEALAEQLRAMASALRSPDIPPEKKLDQLAALERKLQQTKTPSDFEKKPQPQTSTSNQTGKGQGKGKGDSGKGEGSGKSENGGSGGEGNGKGDANGKNKGGESKMMEVRNEISKTKTQLENENKESDKTKAGSGQSKKNDQTTLKPGDKPNQPGATPHQGGSGQAKQPKPDMSGRPEQAKANKPSKEQQDKDRGQPGGDTHLGQIPQAVSFEKFYKPGEHGPQIEIKDARYVLFRVPPAASTPGTGKTVLDKERPTASTPYSNLPLKETRLQAAPDERQLVPPRYRDLLQ